MKTTHTLLTFFITLATAAAAPALIWKNGASQTTLHHSDAFSISEILPHERGVVFVLQRLLQGDEALTGLALPQASALPAHCHHHSVTGVTSVSALAQQASVPVAQVTLDEYKNLPQVIQDLQTMHNGVGKRMMKSKLRAQELQAAQVLFVSVDAESDPHFFDATLVQAIQTEPHVVLTAVRSIQEIKREREMAMQHRMQMQRKAGLEQQATSRRRRLEEDAGQQNQQEQQNNHQYMNLVHMTPNILSGILFTLLFATITMIGISCMGAIQGQDVYVKKMPAIGREA